ncbi:MULTISPECIES: DUF3800 domain-containing protein [Pseudofrankia]|uniref:DUF3800 domain-containing protein n=1 Tax=Pseudofrankia TaxID=2994363 RepID=UPI000234D591|nr:MULTISPECIES: DUF3800 domain-containing protein [Pseudofrankia]OHV33855.1 hypothetical protein BCD49_25340 [Pseudofrankia sp. EUN1h]
MFHAYLDESGSDQARDPHTYLLAAAICEPAKLDQLRSTMRDLLLPGQVKVHWRAEQEKRRRQIMETVASIALEHIVVIRDGREGERSERRRRHCLERMLFELDQLGVEQVVVESRGRKDDQRDRGMLDILRTQKVVRGQLRMDHRPGPEEALLWIADAICGAVTRDRTGDPQFLETVSSRLTVISIEC